MGFKTISDEIEEFWEKIWKKREMPQRNSLVNKTKGHKRTDGPKMGYARERSDS